MSNYQDLRSYEAGHFQWGYRVVPDGRDAAALVMQIEEPRKTSLLDTADHQKAIARFLNIDQKTFRKNFL
jgi:hypothetical protein